MISNKNIIDNRLKKLAVGQQKYPTPEERLNAYESLICVVCERTGRNTTIVRHHIKYFPEEKTIYLCTGCHRWLHLLSKHKGVRRRKNANFTTFPEPLRREILARLNVEGLARKQRRMGGTASKYVGVTRQRDVWESRIVVNGQVIALGCYDRQEDAARAYDIAARFYRGKLARTNFALKEPPKAEAI